MFSKILSSICAIPNSALQHRALIWQLSKREIVGRYKGSVGGILWSFINPLIMLTIYTFIFSVVFQARWGIESSNKIDFALILFAGLIPYQLFAECITKAPSIILNNVNYVKKIVFPLEILPWVQLIAGLFHMLISLVVLILFWGFFHHQFHWTVVLVPLVNLPLICFVLGLMWFLASIAVFFRDIIQTLSMITLAFLFLSPVFYPIAIIPEPYQSLIQLNPLSLILEQNRQVILWGILPNWSALLNNLGIALLFATGGFYWFQKTSSTFADVL